MNPLHAQAIEEEKEGESEGEDGGEKYQLLDSEDPIELQNNVLNPLSDLDVASQDDSGEKKQVIGLQKIEDGAQGDKTEREEEQWEDKAEKEDLEVRDEDEVQAERLQDLNQRMEDAIA